MAMRIIEMDGAEPQRRFSDDDKARIVLEVMMPGASFVPVEVASVSMASQPELLGPGMVEVFGPAGQRIRLTPPIDARVLKTVLAGFA